MSKKQKPHQQLLAMQATKATQEAANFCSTYFIKKGLVEDTAVTQVEYFNPFEK